MAQGIPLRFDVYQGGNLVRSQDLDQDIIKVGKLSSSHLRVDDPAVSRMHAVIEVTGGTEAHIIDLGSARGTVVNGERVNKHLLATGDRIQFGNTTLVAWVGAEDVGRAASGAVAAAPPGGPPPDLVETDPNAAQQPLGTAPARAARKPRFEVGAVQQYYQQQERANDARMAAEGAAMEVDDPAGGHVCEIVEMTGDTVHSVRIFPGGRDVILGDRPRGRGPMSRGGTADYVVDTDVLGQDSFTLVKSIGESFALNFLDVMSGQVQPHGGVVKSLPQLVEAGEAIPSDSAPGAKQWMMPAGATSRVTAGGGTFLVRIVPAPKALGLGTPAPVTRAEMGYMGVSILAHALFLFLAFIVPPQIDGFSLDSFDASNRFVQFIVSPEREDEPDLPDWFNDIKEKKKEKKKSPAKQKSDEGKMGKKDSKDVDKKFAVKGPKDNKELRLAKIREKVKNVGVFQGLSAAGGLQSLWGDSATTVGSDAIHAIGNWQGSGVGHARGFGGFGIAGTGRGGGGHSEASIGLGNLGTRGRGGGNKKFGRGAGNLGERTGRVPRVIAGRAVITGALDKDIIRRVINQHRDAIKYCYDKELQKKRDLHGKIVVTFVIAPNGRVIKSKVRETTMKNKKVENCVTARVKRFKFPAPKGGGIVEVSYPFIFKAS